MKTTRSQQPERTLWAVVRRTAIGVGVVIVFAGLVVPSSAFAQAQPKKKGAIVPKTLQAADGFPIAITYYESTMGKDAPVVILLHMKGGNRLVWKDGLANDLQDQGFAVITVDLRKHGESVVKNGGGKRKKGMLNRADYLAMVAFDLEAVKEFIFEQHMEQKLNMRKTAIVAPEFSAPIAAAFAVRDWLKKPHPDAPNLDARTPRGQDIRALVLISPQESVQGVFTLPNLGALSSPAWGVHFMVIYGSRDSAGVRASKSILKKLLAISANKKRVYEGKQNTKLRGTDMLGRKLGVEAIITGFLTKHVKDLPDPWIDRRSRLKR